MKFYILSFIVSLSLGLTACSASEKSVQESSISSDVSVEESTTLESEPISVEETLPEKREDATFRNAKWGDNIETVQEYEAEIELMPFEVDNSISALAGNTTINGSDFMTFYYFDENDKLYRSGYTLVSDTIKGNYEYISDYNNLKEDLTSLYGNPIIDEIVPLDSLSSHADEGTALSLGLVAYQTIWGTEDTNIMLGMKKAGLGVNLIMIYDDANYNYVENPGDSGL